MFRLIIRFSVLSIGLCVATTSCQDVQQSQLASLNERMNQMISALYSPPFLSKSTAKRSSSPSEAPPAPSQEPSPYAYTASYVPASSAPQVIYVSSPHPPPPSPPYLEAGLQPVDYAHPEGTNPIPRAAYPSSYPYDYSYPSVPYAYPPMAYPYPYPPVPKPCEYGYYPTPEYPPSPSYHPTPGHPPVSPPTYHPPLPSYPPSYHTSPPVHHPHSTPAPSYHPAPYPKHPDPLPSSHYP